MVNLTIPINDSKSIAQKFKQFIDCNNFKHNAIYRLFKKHTPFSIFKTINHCSFALVDDKGRDDMCGAIHRLSSLSYDMLLIHLKLKDWNVGDDSSIEQLLGDILENEINVYKQIEQVILSLHEGGYDFYEEYFIILHDLKNTFLKIFLEEKKLNVQVY